MGLGLSKSNDGGDSTFLSIAGGYIWDKSKDSSHPLFATQEYAKIDDTIGVRQGAKYDNFNGKVVGVRFNQHEKYGESVLVTLTSGDERFIVSIGTNNRNSQDMLKVLLKMDFEKNLLITPYDFLDKVKNKRVQGISFRQDGEKINLRNDNAPFKDGDFFKNANKKQIKRFFEDLTEWFTSTVTKEVIDVHFPEGAESSVEPVKTTKTVKEVKIEDSPFEDVAELSSTDLDNQLGALLG